MLQSESATSLNLQLLGPPQVIRDGRRVTGFRSSKAQALLHFLAMVGASQRRTTLAALLWPEADEKQAGASLRNVLSNLHALVGDHLTVTREAAVLHRDALELDVAQFDALLKPTGDTDTDILQTEAAVSLYRGDFLEGFHIPDVPQFEQWATIERERLRQAVLSALLTLADWHAAQQDYAASLEDLARLLAIDPANEAGHRQKMIVLARMSQRSAALQQYEVCRRILAEELGVEPSPQTTAVYELILAGALETQPQTAREAWRGGTVSLRAQSPVASAPALSLSEPPRVAWRDLPERTTFHGRQRDLAQLSRWLTTDEAGLVAISGMGGVGKTTLAVELVARLASGSFDVIVWRSLVNAPPLDAVLNAWLQTMAAEHLDSLPESMDEKLSMLFDELRRQRCLLVLDNLESIIEPGDRSGQFRAGCEEYGQLIDYMGRNRHRSCLLLTTRDLPRGLRTLEEDTPRVRILLLEGLPPTPGISLLRDRGVSAEDSSLETLVEHYSGNPLALKLVADTVRDMFGNDVSAFLDVGTPVFDDIRSVLDEQVGRLSALGREIATWLAIERKPVTVQTLWHDLARPPRQAEFLEVMRSLQNGSLVEVIAGHTGNDGMRLALQNVVMEYLTDRLVGALCDEIASGRLVWLHHYALVKAQSDEHIQGSQRRLLLEPIVRWLANSHGRPGAIERLRDLLTHLRQEAVPATSYAAANILHLLLHLETELKDWDFSGLAVWQADLRTASLAGVDFRGADLRGSTFVDTFGVVKAIAISPDGRYLAAGESDGNVFVWRMTDYQPHLLLQGHTHTVSCVAFSPNSAMLASGGFDGRVCLWDATTGEPLATLPAHTDTIGGIAFSPDGHYLASGAADRRIIVWNWRRNEICCNLQETASVNGLIFSPDGEWLISAKDDKQANIWDWRRGTILRTLSGHEDKLSSVACSPDGAWAATGGEDSRICLWQLAAPGACHALNEHRGWVWSLAFSPDGKSLASASADRTVRLWDVATGRVRRTLIGHTSWVSAVAYSPDGRMIASGGYDQTIRLWEDSTGLVLRTLHGHQLRVDLVSFSPQGTLLASSSLDGPVHLWDVHSRRHSHRLVGHRGAIRAVAVNEINKLVAGGCDDHRVYLWDIEKGGLRQTLLGHTDLVRHVAFSPNGRYLVTGSHDLTLRIWEATSGRLRHVIHGAVAKIQSATAFNPDGLILAYGGDDGTVKLWDIGGGKILETLPVGEERPVTVAFSPQGRLLACGMESGALWVWRVHTGRASNQIELWFRVQQAARAIWRILFSQDEKLLAVCGSDGARQVIELISGKLAYSLPDATGAFNLAFDRDARYLLTASAEGVVVVRDAETGEVRRMLHGHSAEVTALDVSPVENVIASSSVDGTVRLWRPETGDCLATLVPGGPYEGMNIAGATGITPAQRTTLVALGAIEE